MKITLTKVVSRTYQLSNGGFYKPQYEMTVEYNEEETSRDDFRVKEQQEWINECLEAQLIEEKKKLWL